MPSIGKDVLSLSHRAGRLKKESDAGRTKDREGCRGSRLRLKLGKCLNQVYGSMFFQITLVF